MFIFFIIVCFFNAVYFYNSENNKILDSFLKSENLVISFIDVGQGESILIEAPTGEKMLIDAGGTKEDAAYNYIKDRGIDSLDIVIITHPHTDHISEISNIISNIKVGRIYMPKVQHNTKIFEKMIDTIIEKNILVLEAKSGEHIDFSKDITCFTIAPNSDNYNELNNWSYVIHLTYKSNKFLFTGDAEAISEKEIIESKFNIRSDVLKVGHHGSNSSTSQEFLEAVNPSHAVISAGKNNLYGHPNESVLKRLYNIGAKVHLTSNDGTIVLISDGKSISFIP